MYSQLLHYCHVQPSALQGRHILLTRAAHQLGELEKTVRQRGAVPVAFPCLELLPMEQSVRQHLAALQPGDDIAFTSANGVTSVAQAAEGKFPAILLGHRIAAVGERTAKCLEQHGVKAHIIPKTASQKGLIEAYRQNGLPGRLIFFRAEEGSDELASFLRAHGTEVITVPTYRTVCPRDDASATLQLLQQGRIDAVLLGSPKTARHYLRRIGDRELANRPVIAAISPQVAIDAEAIGLRVQVVAKEASFSSILDCLNEYFTQEGD